MCYTKPISGFRLNNTTKGDVENNPRTTGGAFMISNYPAVFIKNGSGYIVDFPDFECLATEGGKP